MPSLCPACDGAEFQLLFTASDRLGWAFASVGVLLVSAYAIGLPSLARSRNKLLVSAGNDFTASTEAGEARSLSGPDVRGSKVVRLAIADLLTAARSTWIDRADARALRRSLLDLLRLLEDED